MRNKNKPYLFLFVSITGKTLLNSTFLRPTNELVQSRLLLYTGKRPVLSRVRPAFRINKIKSFIFNRRRGNHIRNFFKAKPKKR